MMMMMSEGKFLQVIGLLKPERRLDSIDVVEVEAAHPSELLFSRFIRGVSDSRRRRLSSSDEPLLT